jgi:hypothetical protein
MGGNTSRKNGMLNSIGTTATNMTNTVVGATNTALNTVKNTSSNILKNGPSTTQIILIIAFVFVVIFFSVFWRQIQNGFRMLYDQLRYLLGAKQTPPPPPRDEQPEPVIQPPIPPQEEQMRQKNNQSLVEKILPGRQQVFNISKNSYTYYDAEPLCKALGAELATYEQVKEAHSNGAEWCNYGWVKGQMAVYPTQSDTWEQLQQGPEDQRGSCGQPGLNGGFFDNAELQFGVNCYGARPEQKEHDATAIASGEGAPLSPGGLEFEKKINKYKGEANNISILPFSKSSWSA